MGNQEERFQSAKATRFDDIFSRISEERCPFIGGRIKTGDQDSREHRVKLDQFHKLDKLTS